MATSSSLPKTYLEQQQGLFLLSQFIKEKEEWLESVLKRLQWSREQFVTKVEETSHKIVDKNIIYINH